MNGSIHGGTVNLSWKSDSTADQATFNGTVDGNGNLAGTASFSNGNNAPFVGKNKMVCQDAPPPQQQQTPADNGSAPPQQGPQQSALPKITGGDVDLYTEPGGVGSPVGVVKNGTSVEVLERRPDNWVHVSFFIMTKQANGWVWGDYVPRT